MAKNKLSKKSNSQLLDICIHCDNQIKHSQKSLRDNLKKDEFDSINEIWLKKQQTYLSHIFEAQLRFGE